MYSSTITQIIIILYAYCSINYRFCLIHVQYASIKTLRCVLRSVFLNDYETVNPRQNGWNTNFNFLEKRPNSPYYGTINVCWHLD